MKFLSPLQPFLFCQYPNELLVPGGKANGKKQPKVANAIDSNHAAGTLGPEAISMPVVYLKGRKGREKMSSF